MSDADELRFEEQRNRLMEDFREWLDSLDKEQLIQAILNGDNLREQWEKEGV